MTDKTSLLVYDVTPATFFRERILLAQDHIGVQLNEQIEFYLVNLLCDFLSSKPNSENDCLALILAKALDSGPDEQIQLFKNLGDTALYFSGFFQEFFTSKSFDISYYIGMGQNAYINLADSLRRRSKKDAKMAAVYRELADKFGVAVDVLLDVSEQTGHTQELSRSTLSIYDAWLNTASDKLEKALLARGIIPIDMGKKKM